MKDTREWIYDNLKIIPEKPGVYQFYDKSQNILYIGKAKNLKKRVYSYFNKKQSNQKLRLLVEKTDKIEFIVVNNESDALLLENNLIKKHSPKYNVQLKDDKTFPWICIKKERFPRVFSTRNVINDGSIYYGPYTSALMVKTLLNLVKQLYKTRTCSYKLSKENIDKGKIKKCLEYHIGNCNAPCEGMQTEEAYNQSIEDIKNILKGNIKEVADYLKLLMKQFASEYRFEDAENIKRKIEIIEKYRSKSTIVNSTISNIDIFSAVENQNYAVFNFLKVVHGAIIQSHNIEIKKVIGEKIEDLIEIAITEMYQKIESNSKEIIVPIKTGYNWGKKITVPKIGDKLKLLELSKRNAKYHLANIERKIEENNKGKRTLKILEQIKNDLRLTKLPEIIECIDNSNIAGRSAVAACVVFKNAIPSKKEYRHYNIKTVQGPDDYASMREVIYRRYKRLLYESKKLPDLLIIDGGKGQLNAALKSLEALNLGKSIPVIGIAKRLEEIYFPHDNIPIYIDKNSITLKILQKARDEAHRFGIQFHRNKRSKAMLMSELDGIDGIGQKTGIKLIEKFKDINTIKSTRLEDLAKTIGQKKAEIVFNYYHK